MEKKLNEIAKEVAIFALFLACLFAFVFTNTSLSSLQYNKVFKSLFVDKLDKNELGLDEVVILNFRFFNFPKFNMFPEYR